MPSTRPEHFRHTYDEWTSTHMRYMYFVELFIEKKIRTYVDLGANTGGVCAALLQRVPTLEKAFLFEPQIDNYNFMFELFKDDSRINLYQTGIYYGVTEIPLNRCDDNVGGYTILQDPGFFPTGDIMKCARLEDFDFGKVDFIKIDVEGSELNIIDNSTLLREIDFIEIELHPPYLSRTEEFIKDYIVDNFPEHEVISIAKLTGGNPLTIDGSNVFLKKKGL